MQTTEWAIISGLVGAVVALVGIVYAALDRRVTSLDHPTTGAVGLTAAELRRMVSEAQAEMRRVHQGAQEHAAADLLRVRTEITERQHKHAQELVRHGEGIARLDERMRIQDTAPSSRRSGSFEPT